MNINDLLNIDEIDKQIITIIQQNPKLTHIKIAKKINRSQPTVGARLKKLETRGILQFQPGINFSKLDLYLAYVIVNAKDPKKVLEIIKRCPFMINAFRMSGNNNIYIIVACKELKKLDSIVNNYFRKNPDVFSVSTEIVTEFAKDFIFPINFKINNNQLTSKNNCKNCKFKK